MTRENTILTREQQLEYFADMFMQGGITNEDAWRRAEGNLKEAEARGAAQARAEDAKGQEPVGWYLEEEGCRPWFSRIPVEEKDAIEQRLTVSPLYTHPANNTTLEAENESLREQLAEAKKDTERLEWLYSTGRSMDIVPPNKSNNTEWRVFIDEWLASSGETPRATIDAAMKQNDGETP